MTQKKETKASISSEWFQCPCGAMVLVPKNCTSNSVGLTRYRKSKYASDGGWSVVCTRCGRVGERGHTQAEAKAKWDAGLFKYDPLKEDKDK